MDDPDADGPRATSNLRAALIPICFWAFLHAIDASYFGGILRALEVDLHLNMSDFTRMQGTNCLAVVCCIPFWGFVIDRSVLTPRKLLTLSCLGWGTALVGIGFLADSFASLLFWRFVNTAFLCGCLPITQSIITCVAAPRIRGACFSCCALFGGLGTVVSARFSADISEQEIRGYSGWRVGFIAIGLTSIVFAVLLFMLMPDIAQERDSNRQEGPAWSFSDAMSFLSSGMQRSWSSYSWRALVAQCCAWQCVMQALPYATMWLQYVGYSDSVTGSLSGVWRLGIMVGQFAGGFIGDLLSEANKLHGRQLFGQLVCLGSIPPLSVIFGGSVTDGDFTVEQLGLLFLCLGLLQEAWASGVNKPIMTQIAPREHVASLMAWKMTLDSFLGFALWPNVVARLASYFGYSSSHLRVSEMPEELRAQNADALGNLIFTVSVSGFVAMAVMYTLMQWTFVWDLQVIDKEKGNDAREVSNGIDEAEPLLHKHSNPKGYNG
eukprot:TRINITY_DN14188_c0_g1_i1.p1 TRINITY_DN14188_c0_g1~~TRINITY_DN14188_c0_g1_i1.p1  ORF type:complete len:493 (-),score=62.85 TRINITY_DN14188_c0_g1_i1:92-1570(-)